MPTEEELKAQQEAEKKAKEEKEKKEAEERAKEEEEKIKKIMGDSEAVFSLLEAKRKANAEAKEYRLKLEEIEKKQREADDKALKDQEKFKELAEKKESELTEKEQKFKGQLIMAALKIEAKEQGIIDIDLVKLIDSSAVKVDGDYNVTGTKEAVETFKEAKPDFFKEKEDGGDTGGGPEGHRKPELRQKVTGDVESLTGPQKISKFFEQKKGK